MNAGDDARDLVIEPADTPERWNDVLFIRKRVFAEEQGLVDLGISDSDDQTSLVLVALLDGRAVSTGRLSSPLPGRAAYLSWIATLPDCRGQGVASCLVERLVAAADERQYGEVQLAAQVHAIGLYARFGFKPLGRPYVVRGIPHQTMVRVAPAG